MLATPFESGQAVWPVNQTYSDGKDKPWTGPPEEPGEASPETGPTDPGPAAAQTILEPGQAPAAGHGRRRRVGRRRLRTRRSGSA